MKLYHFDFDGVYLGGEIVIVAKDREQAQQLAEETLKRCYSKLKDPVKSLELSFDCEGEFNPEGCVVHYWDGDY